MAARIPHALPSEISDDGDLARQLGTILGSAYSAPDGSTNAADLLALGAALADARQVLQDALDEAFVDTATDLLGELEASYGLPVRSDLAPTDRRARLVAKVRAARAGTPQQILRAVHALDPTATLHENTPATVVQTPDTLDPHVPGVARVVYVAGLVVSDATYDDAGRNAAIRALLAQMKPAHTFIDVGTSIDFRCDDPNSLCDRDLLAI